MTLTGCHILVALWAWCCLSIFDVVHSASILAIFPMGAKSRFSYSEAMMNSLHEAGHQITFVSPFPDHESMQKYTAIDSRNNTFIHVGQNAVNDFRNLAFPQWLHFFIEMEEKHCDDVLRLPKIQEMLDTTSEHKFDVMFIEILALTTCFLPLAEKLNIPVIGTVTLRSSYLAEMIIGNSYLSSVVPSEFTPFDDKMTFYQRFVNSLYRMYYEYCRRYVIPSKLDRIFRQYYSAELWYKKNVSLLFVNNHAAIFPRAVVPNIIEVGGIHIKPAKPLPKELQKFIDEAKHGVILFTFGSIIKSSTMSMQQKIAFREAFARIPQRVVWKFEETLDDLPHNVMILDWVPQRDILAHKNVKAFISHCGMSGSYESIYEGVPMLFTPLFCDQQSNAAFLEKAGVGVRIDYDTITADGILNALDALINDTVYYENMQELSRLFKDRPMTPQESVVYWTEYVIRNKGAARLRTTAADMPAYQYYVLDIICTIAFGVISIIFIVIYLLKSIYKFCFPHLITVDKNTAKKKL